MRLKFLYAALIVVFLSDLFLIAAEANQYRYFTKTLLMPLLLWVYLKSASAGAKLNFLLISGFVCSFLGDLFLLFPWGFIPGLLGFLVAHLFYIFCFRKYAVGRVSWIVTGLVLLYLIAFLYLIFPYLFMMQIPVTAYALTLCTMLYFALKTRNRWLIAGALLFVVSDSVLAYTLFVHAVIPGQLLVMLTYVFAQVFIMKGILCETREASGVISGS